VGGRLLTTHGAVVQLSRQQWLGCLEVGEDLSGSVWAEKAAGSNWDAGAKGFFGRK
jgi:hypothetical protein